MASFAHLSTELMALGAPPGLIRKPHQDALNEVRHAEVCFSLAYALDGQAMSAGRLPATSGRRRTYSRSLALARLAITSLIDGAVGEGASARILAEVAREADAPEVRAALAGMARDEARHAGHAWGVLKWCLDVGGALVAVAVEGALFVAARAPALSSATGAADLERFGLAGQARERHLRERVRRRGVDRARRLLPPHGRASDIILRFFLGPNGPQSRSGAVGRPATLPASCSSPRR